MTQIRPGSGRPAMGEEDEQVPDRAMRTRFRPTRRNAPAAFLPASPPTRASADLRPGRLRAVSAIRQTDAPLPTSLRAAPDDVMVDPAVSCPAPPRSTTFASSTRYCRWWIGGSRAATPSSTPPSPALAGGRSGGPRCHSLLPSTPAPAPVWVPQRAQDSSPHALTHRRAQPPPLHPSPADQQRWIQWPAPAQSPSVACGGGSGGHLSGKGGAFPHLAWPGRRTVRGGRRGSATAASAGAKAWCKGAPRVSAGEGGASRDGGRPVAGGVMAQLRSGTQGKGSTPAPRSAALRVCSCKFFRGFMEQDASHDPSRRPGWDCVWRGAAA